MMMMKIVNLDQGNNWFLLCKTKKADESVTIYEYKRSK